MIVSIALKEFYTNLVSARFTIGFLLCLVLVPFALLVSINDYKGRLTGYETNLKEAENSLEVRVYSRLRPVVVRKPEPLSVFCRGIDYNFGSKVQIWLGEKPMLAEDRASVRDNPLLNSFFSLDFVTVLAVILSFLALLFSYDACTREREDGTLKLMFSNSLGRANLLLGKLLGICLTVLPVVVFCYLLSALIVIVHPAVVLPAGEWLRLALLFGLSLIYFLLFVVVGLLISTRLRSSSTSIVLCLFFWVAFVFIMPNLATYAARSFVKIDSREALQSAQNDLGREFGEKRLEFRKTLPEPDWYMGWSQNMYRDGGMILSGSSASYMEYIRRQYEFSEPLRIEYADKFWAHQKAYLDKLDRQRSVAAAIGMFSPSEIFRATASALCNTDAGAFNRFMDRAREYREQLIAYFRENDVFSSFNYFSPQPPDTYMTADEIVRRRSGGELNNFDEFQDWADKHNGGWSILFKKDIEGTSPMDFPYLKLDDMPRFTFGGLPLARAVRGVLLEFSILIFSTLLLFYFSFVSFIRYDVR